MRKKKNEDAPNSTENSDGTGTVTDSEGKTYKTVKIGDQWWMAENLAVTKYRNGVPIPEGTGIGDYRTETEPKYYFNYGDNANSAITYGRLYTWYVVNDDRKITPQGWHVATDKEWEILANFISTDNGGYVYGINFWRVVGFHLKATGGWNNNGNGTDDYGFAALPGGFCNSGGSFDDAGSYGYWWSATSGQGETACLRHLNYGYGKLYLYRHYRMYGYAVRCVKDN